MQFLKLISPGYTFAVAYIYKPLSDGHFAYGLVDVIESAMYVDKDGRKVVRYLKPRGADDPIRIWDADLDPDLIGVFPLDTPGVVVQSAIYEYQAKLKMYDELEKILSGDDA